MKLLKYFEKRCKELGLNYGEEPLRPSSAKKPRFEENDLVDSEDEDTEEIQKSR